MTDKALVAEYVAHAAQNAAPLLVEDQDLPQITTDAAAQAAIDRVVKQSAPIQSERVWAAIFAGLTAVLATPEVLDLLGPWAPVATALVSAALAVVSKLTDPRPTR
jgi:hypothetical protein